ncbi:efflux RND transporter periplasmic adaptor subunit [Alteromonas sediminis]|uniref:Efflux RND transporter periplasmic adaptor subunit n=1 Tax=Alteromonas sediminis TaxID=2259342 RepID=A0A3N5YCN8_9ALTE|nr:efflux RND transporter periplasmic adaptor subunit [Alteromonas sediminis]RPJ67055.1 efflux RND transporter periplasmic adaptor subunit [Alteromonas sediminis]
MTAKTPALDQLRIDSSQRSTKAVVSKGVWVALLFLSGSVAGYLYLSQQTSSTSFIQFDTPKTPTPQLTQALAEPIPVDLDESSGEAILDASGHVVARRIATVSSRVTGKLETLHIEEGQQVTRDQVLAKVDNIQAKLAYERANANLAASKASYQELVVLKEHEKKRLKRHQKLNQSQLVSKQLTEDSEMRIDQLTAQINQANAHIQLAQSNLALAKYELDQHQIRAPFDGVVISKNAQVGELISAGMSGGSIRTGVGTIVDMNSLEVEVEVSESYINRIQPDQPVIAKLDAYPSWEIPSEVIAIIPTADRQKASIKVRIRLLEIDSRVLPDMGVRVSFLSPQRDDGLVAEI